MTLWFWTYVSCHACVQTSHAKQNQRAGKRCFHENGEIAVTLPTASFSVKLRYSASELQISPGYNLTLAAPSHSPRTVRSVVSQNLHMTTCATDGYGAINRLYPQDSRSVTQFDLTVSCPELIQAASRQTRSMWDVKQISDGWWSFKYEWKKTLPSCQFWSNLTWSVNPFIQIW